MYARMESCIYIVWCIHACMIAYYSVMDPFGKIRIGYGRFKVVPVMDPIPWRFEDRTMRWFKDPYRFVQWRLDSDSDPKPHHFVWVFVYWSILILAFYLIISCECAYDSCIFYSCPTIIILRCLVLFYCYAVYTV